MSRGGVFDKSYRISYDSYFIRISYVSNRAFTHMTCDKSYRISQDSHFIRISYVYHTYRIEHSLIVCNAEILQSSIIAHCVIWRGAWQIASYLIRFVSHTYLIRISYVSLRISNVSHRALTHSMKRRDFIIEHLLIFCNVKGCVTKSYKWMLDCKISFVNSHRAESTRADLWQFANEGVYTPDLELRFCVRESTHHIHTLSDCKFSHGTSIESLDAIENMQMSMNRCPNAQSYFENCKSHLHGADFGWFTSVNEWMPLSNLIGKSSKMS